MLLFKYTLGVKPVKTQFLLLPCLVFGATVLAEAQSAAVPTKVGIIHIQNALISTKDGQKAAGELQARFGPRKLEIDKKQNEIAMLRDKLTQGSNTMSEEAKQKLMREIDQKTKSLNRDTEDAQAELDQDQQKVMGELLQRMQAVINKYSFDNGYAIIIDVSSQQSPVLYAANGIDISKDIVDLYDKSAAASSAAPVAPTPVAPRPAAPPAMKKAPGTVK
jgi:outer membrane protein